MNTVVDRVFQIIDYYGINKTNFYKKVGLSNGFLDKVKDIGCSKLDLILNSYPEINSEWLLTGRGEMLKEENLNIEIQSISINRKTQDYLKDIQEIPLYNIHATAGLVELFKGSHQDAILDKIRIPGIASCDGAIYITGDSMYPLLKSGDIVLYKEINLDNIFWGEMYLLSVQIDEWNEYISVKFVQKSELGNEYVKLVSQNQYHQPKDVLITKIKAIALIRASIRLHSS